jgi:hypothetical protein
VATTNILDKWMPGDDNTAYNVSAPVLLVPGTNIKAWAFSPDSDMEIVLDGILDGLYGDTTGYTVQIHYATPLNATGAVRWSAAIKRIQDDVDKSDDGTYGTATAANDTVGSVAGEVKYYNAAIAKANDDALAVGENFRLRIQRVTSNAGDTHSGWAYITCVTMTET